MKFVLILNILSDKGLIGWVGSCGRVYSFNFIEWCVCMKVELCLFLIDVVFFFINNGFIVVNFNLIMI